MPIIHFGVGSGEVLDLMAGIGADAVGVDWRIPLDEASRRLGGDVVVQGNIDPALLTAPWEVLERTSWTCSSAAGRHRRTSSTSATACRPRPIPRF